MIVGAVYEFKHRKLPNEELKIEKGKILAIGRTSDGIDYVQTDVGSFTKKFVISRYKEK